MLDELRMSEAICKGCQAPIRWVTLSTGGRMPLDAASVTTSDATRLLYRMDGTRAHQDDWGWLWGYAPHWPVCAAGDRFRRIGGGHKTPYKGPRRPVQPTSASERGSTLPLPEITT